MPKFDRLYRYLFAEHAVRGELVTLYDTYHHILAKHDYPKAVQQLLGEMLAATCLLTATLKFEGTITVQLQGDGPLSLAVIKGNHQQEMRGIARIHGEISPTATLQQMLGNGYLSITIAPKIGNPYQGVVPLEESSLTKCLENYFQQSEQLATRLLLHVAEYEGKPIVGGVLLQVLPTVTHPEEAFNHLYQLTATLTQHELFSLPAQDLLYRLYHQEEVTLFPAQEALFRCTCSYEHTAAVLAMLPAKEIDEILQQDGKIEVHCDYCNMHYIFTSTDLAQYTPPPTLH